MVYDSITFPAVEVIKITLYGNDQQTKAISISKQF